MSLFYIVVFIFVLGIVILIHEFGHFLFARRAGILCHEFSIGMGPALYKVKRNETTYAIRAIPIGGYVSMAGEEPETEKIKKDQIVFLKIEQNLITKIYLYKPDNEQVKYARVIDFDLYGKDGNDLYIHFEDELNMNHTVKVKRDAMYYFNEKSAQQIAPYDRCFESKPWLDRFLTVVAGAGFNFILAIIVFILLNFITGIPQDNPIIGAVTEDSPAYNSGITAGDEIISIDGKRIKNWNDISKTMNDYSEGSLTVVLKRDNEELTKVITPEIFIATLGIKSTTDIENSTEIDYVSPNSNADKEGLRSGDKIIRIEGTLNDDKNTKQVENDFIGEDVRNWYEVKSVLDNFYLSEKVNITILRGNDEKVISVNTIKALEPDNVSRGMIGIGQDTNSNFIQSITGGFKQTAGVIGSIFATLDLLFTDKNVSVSDLSGPVGIYDMTKTVAMAGFISLLSWLAFISANIGFVNLLPLPALDGGRLLFLLVEGVVRKPVNRKVEGYIHTVGFILFMMLFLFITFNDILRLRG